MIKPTVGRVLYYVPSTSESIPHNQSQPLAAIITYVWSDNLVNLAIFDADGNSHPRTSVPLAQPGSEIIEGGCYWMPYQVGQAAKTEELQAKLEEEGAGA